MLSRGWSGSANGGGSSAGGWWPFVGSGAIPGFPGRGSGNSSSNNTSSLSITSTSSSSDEEQLFSERRAWPAFQRPPGRGQPRCGVGR
jgi:hypothetical protein